VCVEASTVYPPYGAHIPPELHAAGMAHLAAAGLGSLSPGSLAYARAAMVSFLTLSSLIYLLMNIISVVQATLFIAHFKRLCIL